MAIEKQRCFNHINILLNKQNWYHFRKNLTHHVGFHFNMDAFNILLYLANQDRQFSDDLVVPEYRALTDLSFINMSKIDKQNYKFKITKLGKAFIDPFCKTIDQYAKKYEHDHHINGNVISYNGGTKINIFEVFPVTRKNHVSVMDSLSRTINSIKTVVEYDWDIHYQSENRIALGLLGDILISFYQDRGMLSYAFGHEYNRLIGLPHEKYPTLTDFEIYLDAQRIKYILHGEKDYANSVALLLEAFQDLKVRFGSKIDCCTSDNIHLSNNRPLKVSRYSFIQQSQLNEATYRYSCNLCKQITEKQFTNFLIKHQIWKYPTRNIYDNSMNAVRHIIFTNELL